MIPDNTLRYLIVHRLKDAESLLKEKRYPAAIYLAGYAVEVALKRRICNIFKFYKGFPETRQELSLYQQFAHGNLGSLIQVTLKDIRNHDLNKLLFHSGIEMKIRDTLPMEWHEVTRWDPGNRYRKMRVVNQNARSYIRCAKKILKEIR